MEFLLADWVCCANAHRSLRPAVAAVPARIPMVRRSFRRLIPAFIAGGAAAGVVWGIRFSNAAAEAELLVI